MSRIFRRFDIPALTAGEVKEYSPENNTNLKTMRRYFPLDYLSCTNLSLTVSVSINLNYSAQNKITVAPGGVKVISGVPFSSFQVKNEHASTSTGATDIVVEVERS